MLPAGLDLRKASENLIRRIVDPVLVSDGPSKHVNELMAKKETLRTNAVPKWMDECVAVGDRHGVDPFWAKRRQDVPLKTGTVPANRIRCRPTIADGP